MKLNFHPLLLCFSFVVFGLFPIVDSSGQTNPPKLKFQIQCENLEKCPEAVAAFLHTSGGRCSSFLIAPDIMATNMHCVPPGLKNEGDSCYQKSFFVFPKTLNKPHEVLDCDKLIHASRPLGDWVLVPDYAFFKLKNSSQRTPLEISRKGFADKSVVEITKVDFASPSANAKKNEPDALVKSISCHAVQNSTINPHFTSDFSSVVSFGKCDIIPGNSGSPILDSQGSVRGVISARQTPIIKSPGVSEERVWGFGANFACLNTGFLGIVYGNPPECSSPQKKIEYDMALKELFQKKLREIEPILNKKVQSFLWPKVKEIQKSTGLIWGVQPVIFEKKKLDKYESMVAMKPQCLPKVNLPYYYETSRRKNLLETQTFSEHRIAGLGIGIGSDPDGRMELIMDEVHQKATVFFTTKKTIKVQIGSKISELPSCESQPE
jgi:Trypsin-like peptidase domain